jgi:outer membrane protein OmpA-like peptidoglycan-associated protein
MVSTHQTSDTVILKEGTSMTRRVAAWALVGLLPLAVPARAQSSGAGAEMVKKEDVKTWIATIEGKEFEMRPAAPSYMGDTGLFRLGSAYTLPKGKASVSFFADNLDRDPKGLDVYRHGLTFGYGATAKLEVFGDIGLQNRVKVNNTSQAGFVNDFPFAGTAATSAGWQTGMGDLTVGAKYKMLDDYRKDQVGLAIRGYLKLPTADEAKGLGTGKASGGADLILSKSMNRQADLHASIGYQINGDPDKIKIGNAFNWGVGVNVPALKVFQLQAELSGSAYSGADFSQTSPIDFIIGPAIFIKPGFFVRPAFSYALGYDGRGADVSSGKKSGAHLSIGYHPGTPAREIAPPPPPPPAPAANRPPTVSVSCERPVILPGEKVRCRATAADPDGDPLTYQWSASACVISGNGAEATLDCTGAATGAAVTVRVAVSDGRGGNAEASTQVRVEAPAKKAEAQTLCDSSGFPRNMARLNNIDKACLDDVASRLRQDPRSRVLVIGHADKAEKTPEVIARKRAEAIKEYLVKQRGVDEARISVRSAAAGRPVDTGATAKARAKNRRVEVVFAPEGATVPDYD